MIAKHTSSDVNKASEIIKFIFLALAMLIIATRLATFIHEVFGHGLVAILTGGEIFNINISLFGGGLVNASISGGNTYISLLFSYSGIILNLATGLFVIYFLIKKNLVINIYTRLFLSFLLLISLNGSLAYIILGIYYNYGDPIDWATTMPKWYQYCWMPALMIAPISSFISTKIYLTSQEKLFPTKTNSKRLRLTLMTIGVPTIIYFALFLIAEQKFASTDAPAIDHQRQKEKIIDHKKDILKQKLIESEPQLTNQEADTKIEDLVKTKPIIINEEDIPMKLPLIYILLLFLVTGGLFAIYKANVQTAPNPKKELIKLSVVILFIVSATTLLGIIKLLNSQIYPL